jgi:hypothetical protein
MELFGGIMKMIVQQLRKKLYLREDSQWTAARSEAVEFKTVVDAIRFCIHRKAGDVKLVGRNEAGEDIFLYPFGGDPAARVELRRLRKTVRENRRLKTEQRLKKGHVDVLLAEVKEARKRLVFKRNETGEAE